MGRCSSCHASCEGQTGKGKCIRASLAAMLERSEKVEQQWTENGLAQQVEERRFTPVAGEGNIGGRGYNDG